MSKPWPDLKTDEEAEHFVATADLTEYDVSVLRRVHFEFAPKDRQVNMRLPERLLTAVKARAAASGMPYQRFIRHALEQALAKP